MTERIVKIMHIAKDISLARNKMNVVLRNLENVDHQEKLVCEVRFIDKCIDKILHEVINGFANYPNSDSPGDDCRAIS